MKQYFKVLQNYAAFKGRAGRKEYWYFILFNLITVFLLSYAGVFMNVPNLTLIYMALVFTPAIAVHVRRMHDVGKSGWFVLVPFYNMVLACTDSVKGTNEYGAEPETAV